MSSRQKMINMMYLVLLAMLALNVDAEVLDAFVSIKNQLEISVNAASELSDDFIGQMQSGIDEEIQKKGKMDNAGLKDTLEQIHEKTEAMVNLLNKHILEMEELAGQDEETGEYKKMDEVDQNYRYWMGANEESAQRRGDGEAKDLRDKIDEFNSYLTAIANAQLPDSLKTDPISIQDPQDPLDPRKRWEQATFDGPVVANLATLEGLKIDIYRQEKQLLDLLNTRLGVNRFVPDSVIAIAAPRSRVVAAGLPYEANLFIAMSSKVIKPQFSSSQGTISQLRDGNAAQVKITADASVIPQGKTEGLQKFSAVIRVPKTTGGFEELKLEESFLVRKPEVVVSSAAVQQLYRNCMNPLNVRVPALGDAYRPVFEATGANIATSNRNPGTIMVLPERKECILKVSNQVDGKTYLLDQIRYRVVKPPKPQVRVKVNNRNLISGADIQGNSRLQVQILPDEEFRSALRDEARYAVDKIELLLKDGLEPPRVVKTLNVRSRDATQGINFRLPTEISRANSGSRIFIRLNSVYRVNARDRYIEDKRFSELERVVPFVLK